MGDIVRLRPEFDPAAEEGVLPSLDVEDLEQVQKGGRVGNRGMQKDKVVKMNAKKATLTGAFGALRFILFPKTTRCPSTTPKAVSFLIPPPPAAIYGVVKFPTMRFQRYYCN